MNLELLKEYFTFLANTQVKLEYSREKLQTNSYNSYSFFKLLSPKSAPDIDDNLLMNFLKSFPYDFTLTQPDQINKKANYQIHPIKNFKDQQSALKIGVALFLKKWSKGGKMNFQDFAYFFKQRQQLPEKARQVQYPVKKRFFEMIQIEIQCLIDIDSYRKAIALEYKNITDLFQTLASDNILTLQSINWLYMMDGERKDKGFLEKIAKRFAFPCNFDQFRIIFSGGIDKGKYKKQTKIFYSALRRKRLDFGGQLYNHEETKFLTPVSKKSSAVGLTSTKRTKGQILQSLRQGAVEVSKFNVQCPEATERNNTEIIEQILIEQQKLNQIKTNLIFQEDFDLQLIYERRGNQFQQILNNCYGSCNFTSFVRFLVPQDFEHRFLSFTKYQKQHKLSEQTQQMIDNLLDSYEQKEEKIANWWTYLDKEVIFRSYCYPKSKGINRNEVPYVLKFIQISKYFTERQTKILFDRMDPNKTGQIYMENFK